MEQSVERYFEEYVRLLRAIEVTDAQGNTMSFATGVRQAIGLLRERTSQGCKIMFIGNGGSAAIASHFALDYWHAGGMRSIAFNDGLQLTCLSNDHGYEQVFAMPIRMFADAGDVLVAISSSGSSVNILNGVAAARERRCYAVTLSGFDPDNPLRPLGDFNFYVPARHYGYVESVHEIVLHCLLDLAKQMGADALFQI
jgi:D-sedoheptulose 7-phosphate isomerase